MEITIKKKRTDSMMTYVLADYYNEVLNHMNRGYDVNTLFSKTLGIRFIQEYFSEECKNAKVKECIKIITPFRATHTVSAFLLGLTIKRQLQFDLRSWRRLPRDNSPAESFELFWSWICLFHDIGYKLEEAANEYRTCSSADELITFLKIKHSLLDESEYGTLIRRYYTYRFKEFACVDHGIAGALLLYDALIDLAEQSQKYAGIKHYERFFVTICDTIALHNMWRATPDVINRYLAFGLTELIPDDDRHHVVFYKDHPLLFLLAFVDTIEPIKAMRRDKRYHQPMTATEVLEKTEVSFINRAGLKKISMLCHHSSFSDLVATVTDPNLGMMSWLGVYVQIPNSESEERLEIIIDLNGTTQHDEEKTEASGIA